MLSERFLLRKFEICACLNPVRSASLSPVISPASMRFHSAFRRFSWSVLTFIVALYREDIHAASVITQREYNLDKIIYLTQGRHSANLSLLAFGSVPRRAAS